MGNREKAFAVEIGRENEPRAESCGKISAIAKSACYGDVDHRG